MPVAAFSPPLGIVDVTFRMRAPAVALAGALLLPSLQLAGSVTPGVTLADGTLALPGLQLAGADGSAVALAGGAFTLPPLQLAASLTPVVAFAGAPTLPSLALAATFSPAVAFADGTLTLPGLQMAGVETDAVTVAGTIALPSLALAGAFNPVVLLTSTLTLPSLQLAGSESPAVALAPSTLTLPSLQLAGTLVPVVALAGGLVLPSLQLADTLAVSADLVAWLHATATSGSVSSVTDVLNANPATQATAVNQPTAVALNSFPALSFDGVNDWLAWPLTAANNASQRWGIALWIKFGSVSGLHCLLTAARISGASADRFDISQNGAGLFWDVYTSDGVSRRATMASGLDATTPKYVTLEYDGGQASEVDRCIITLGNVKQTLAFANSAGTPPGSTMPATLVAPTGAYAIGVQNISTNLRPLSATIGTSIRVLGGGGGISGGGLLTSAQRAVLQNYEPAV